MMKTALLIPIYQPEEKSLAFLREFAQEDFDSFLVVDDGSGEKYQGLFKKIQEETPFDVFSYPDNHGKGYALKSGIKKLLERFPDLDYIVTADGDGQHLRKDILNIRSQLKEDSQELLLGTRDFSLPHVPKKSRVGNHFSSFVFKLYTGQKIHDTQTGLRAIPKQLFITALSVEGNRYEYENNFLISAAREAKIEEIPIETIYENNNSGSHYRPFRDSLLIAKTPLLYLLTSLLSSLIDLGIFSLFVYLIFTSKTEVNTAVSTVISRVLSGVFNFFMLRYFVFKGKENTARSALKYLLLFSANMILSASLTAIFTNSGQNLTFLKFIIDALIAILNYFINRLFVFTDRIKKGKKEKK